MVEIAWFRPEEPILGLTDTQYGQMEDLPAFNLKPGFAKASLAYPFGAYTDFFRRAAGENNCSPWDLTRSLRSDGSPKKDSGKYYERFIYVGDVHGSDHHLVERLYQFVGNPPNFMVFLGDLTGSEEMEYFKKLFYNYVTNHSKPLIEERRKAGQELLDRELLGYSPANAPETNFNLRSGYLKLLAYQRQLEGKKRDEIEEGLAKLTDQEIAQGIKDVSAFRYYGDFVALLPRSVRSGVLRTLESSAKSLAEPLLEINKKGTKVIMLEGNWDRDGIGGVAEISGQDIEPFSTKGYFRNLGFEVVDEIKSIETDTTLQVLAPFFELLNFEQVDPAMVLEVCEKSARARKEGKSVILPAHQTVSFLMHNLARPSLNPQIEDRVAISNLLRIVKEVKPDEIVHGHQHNPMIDADGKPINLRTKYLIEGRDGQQIVVSYVPWRMMAELYVPRKDPRKGIIGWGGGRQPLALIDLSK